MASINGIEIKNLKTFRDHEGAQIAQGDVWCDGKKVGFWSQDSWGGPDLFDGCEKIVAQRAKLFAEWYPKEDKYADFQDDPAIFMGHLLALKEDEKTYNKYFKKGYPSLVCVTDGWHYSAQAFAQRLTKASLESDVLKPYIDEMLKGMFMGSDKKVYMYTAKTDFKIVCDKNHPVPDRFVV